MMKNYINKLAAKDFDCCHLAASYLQNEMNIDTSAWNSVSREYDIKNEYEYIHNHMLTTGNMMEIQGAYQKGDIILYSKGVRTCTATCIDDKVALILERRSKLIQIYRIENIKCHLRHKSLL